MPTVSSLRSSNSVGFLMKVIRCALHCTSCRRCSRIPPICDSASPAVTEGKSDRLSWCGTIDARSRVEKQRGKMGVANESNFSSPSFISAVTPDSLGKNPLVCKIWKQQHSSLPFADKFFCLFCRFLSGFWWTLELTKVISVFVSWNFSNSRRSLLKKEEGEEAEHKLTRSAACATAQLVRAAVQCGEGGFPSGQKEERTYGRLS